MFVIRHVTRNWDKFVKWPSVQNLYFPAIHRMKATESYPSTIYDEHLTKMQERNKEILRAENGQMIPLQLRINCLAMFIRNVKRRQVYTGMFTIFTMGNFHGQVTK